MIHKPIKKFGEIRKPGLLGGFSLFENMAKNCGLVFGMTDGQTDRLNSYDAINNGTTFKMAGVYPEVVAADVNNILYDVLEEPIELVIATQSNITDNQLFFDNTTGRVLFFSIPLTGICEIKAEKFLGFNENLFVAEGAVSVDDGLAYVAKEGVTQI